jgi:hypothetical protein
LEIETIAVSQKLGAYYWEPVGRGIKTTMCGPLRSYSQTGTTDWTDIFSDPIGFLSDSVSNVSDLVHKYWLEDTDYNLIIEPTGKFLGLAEPFQGPGALHRGLVEGEISIPGDINPWMFSTDNGRMLVDFMNTRVCFHGPMVVDHNAFGHGLEIHPAEQIWRAEALKSGTLLATADYSGRFNDAGDFFLKNPKTPPRPFIPWVPARMPITWSIAFRANSLNDPQRYGILTEAAHHVERPTSDGGTHLLLYRDPAGKEWPLIQVDEVASWLGDQIAIDFRDVARYSDGSIRGYVVVGAALLTPPDFPSNFLSMTRAQQATVLEALRGGPGAHLGLAMAKGLFGFYDISIERISVVPPADNAQQAPAGAPAGGGMPRALLREGSIIELEVLSSVGKTASRVVLGSGGSVAPVGGLHFRTAGPAILQSVSFAASASEQVPESQIGLTAGANRAPPVRQPAPAEGKSALIKAALVHRTRLGSVAVDVPSSTFGKLLTIRLYYSVRVNVPHPEKLSAEAQHTALGGRKVETLELSYRVTKEPDR